MTITLSTEQARITLFVLEQATSFTSKKARDKHQNTVESLRSALAQQAKPSPAPAPRCQQCVDRQDGFYGSWAPDCPIHDAAPPAPAPKKQATIQLGAGGSAYDAPDAPDAKRAYTYKHQPGNPGAYKLGRAAAQAAKNPGGDYIDGGLSLLQALEAEGFGVFQIGAEATTPQEAPATSMDYGMYCPGPDGAQEAPEGLTDDDIWRSDAIMSVNARLALQMPDLLALCRAIESATLAKVKPS